MAAFFRREYGRLMAALVSRLGDFDLAEDAIQEAMIAAVRHWDKDATLFAQRSLLLERESIRSALDRYPYYWTVRAAVHHGLGEHRPKRSNASART